MSTSNIPSESEEIRLDAEITKERQQLEENNY